MQRPCKVTQARFPIICQATNCLSGEAEFSLKPLSSRISLKGVTIFTDGSGRTGKAIVTWKEGDDRQTLEGYESGSPQMVELRAVAMSFQHFPSTPLNVVTDSAYVADITQRLDQALLKEVENVQLFKLQ